MSKNYFISDPHFGHKFMAEMRGFKSILEHNYYIISQWNKVVTKRDTVYIIGDITMHDSKSLHLLGQLNGEKIVIGGNHDVGKGYNTEILKYVKYFAGCKRFSEKGVGAAILTHIPIHPIEFEHNYNKIQYNIHGHIHGAYVIDDPKYINVCAEVIDYIPRTFKELIENV